MALIKCIECKKKISDTVDKCPHCGIDLTKVSKEELKVKEFKLKKKHIVIGGIVLGILLVLFLCYKMIFPANGNVNKAIKFLENNGYECEKISNPFIFQSRGEVVCEDRNSNDIRREFTITWDGGFSNFASDLINSKELFDSEIYIQFNFYNRENDYVFIDINTLDEYYALVMQDGKTSDELCVYWPVGSDSNNRSTLGDKDVETHYDDCDYGYSSYVDEINDSLDDIRDLLEELDME